MKKAKKKVRLQLVHNLIELVLVDLERKDHAMAQVTLKQALDATGLPRLKRG